MRPQAIRPLFAGLGFLLLTGAAYAQTGDRYGSGALLYATPGSKFAPPRVVPSLSPPSNVAPAPISAVATPPAMSRMLSWPGKTPSQLQVATSPGPTTSQVVAPLRTTAAKPREIAFSDRGWVPVAAAHPAAPRLGPPVRPWTQRYAATPSAAPPAAASTYAAATPPNPSTGAPVGGARYYSLHRAYGMTPDAAPIPPQFFGPTADLGAPETQDAVRRANATAAAVNTARLATETAQ